MLFRSIAHGQPYVYVRIQHDGVSSPNLRLRSHTRSSVLKFKAGGEGFHRVATPFAIIWANCGPLLVSGCYQRRRRKRNDASLLNSVAARRNRRSYTAAYNHPNLLVLPPSTLNWQEQRPGQRHRFFLFFASATPRKRTHHLLKCLRTIVGASLGRTPTSDSLAA